jgi:hypothetical protein
MSWKFVNNNDKIWLIRIDGKAVFPSARAFLKIPDPRKICLVPLFKMGMFYNAIHCVFKENTWSQVDPDAFSINGMNYWALVIQENVTTQLMDYNTLSSIQTLDLNSINMPKKRKVVKKVTKKKKLDPYDIEIFYQGEICQISSFEVSFGKRFDNYKQDYQMESIEKKKEEDYSDWYFMTPNDNIVQIVKQNRRSSSAKVSDRTTHKFKDLLRVFFDELITTEQLFSINL